MRTSDDGAPYNNYNPSARFLFLTFVLSLGAEIFIQWPSFSITPTSVTFIFVRYNCCKLDIICKHVVVNFLIFADRLSVAKSFGNWDHNFLRILLLTDSDCLSDYRYAYISAANLIIRNSA